MSDRLSEILDEIRELEKSIQVEMRRREEELRYSVRKGKVIFEKEILELHRKIASSWFLYIIRASYPNVLSAPVIYTMIIPALLLDLCLWIYQSICFPIYGIPKVRRRDHIILDRHYLKYLNFIERLNCDYCSYFNGLASYATEIAGRTEQYWCPIKHASGKARRHSRYHLFLDYGDAEAYRKRLTEIRKKYDDL
ncbi:MAG TPA: hypothetical protein VEI96_01165, partial [Thermodesulfovibrionales bacterium]|nr:hypothetical protein [Thermodesulfovibrionales bacterium]